nr:NDP-sugar synthase [Calditerricola satsumensis]
MFSDKVNTGIYILEPRIFSFYEKNREFDFSKDLFPLLMARGEPLYGYVAEGYWSDIGNLAQYRQAQFDLLDGKVNVTLPGREIAPGVRAEAGAVIEDGATVVGPAFLGRDVRVQRGAVIDGYTVIGSGSILKAGASVKRSILWDRVVVEGGAELRGDHAVQPGACRQTGRAL